MSSLPQTQENLTETKKLKVATVCMNPKLDTETNIQTIKTYMKKASNQGAKLIVFPEIALQQNPGWGTSEHQPSAEELEYLHDTAETIPGPSTTILIETAKEHDIFIVYGMTEKDPNGKLYNSSVFLGPDGLIGKYRKRHLWDYETGGNEHLSWRKGVESGVFDSPIGRVGLMICIEMAFGFSSKLVEEGVDFLVTVSAWPDSAGDKFDNHSVRNAVDSGCWHIVSNQVGVVGHAVDYGHSRIISPSGEVVADTGAEEGIVIASISF